jgi:hypothetical protein
MNLPKISDKIKAIINRYNLLLKYMVLGPKALTKPQIKMLVLAGLIKQHHIQFTFGDAYLKGHVDALKGASSQSIRNRSIQFLLQNAGQFIDRFAERQSAEIPAIIQNQIMAYVQQMRDTTKDVIAQGVIRAKSSSSIVQELKEKTGDYAKDWDRVVTTELVRAHNLGTLDAVIENNKGKSHDDVYVYKTGPNDMKTCKYCKEFWFMPDGSPRVHKLSEIVANGSNVGRKAAEWKPCVDTTHPNCRHYMIEIEKGFGFQNGQLSWVHKDHVEYDHQNRK